MQGKIFILVLVWSTFFLIVAFAWTNPSANPPTSGGAVVVDSSGRVGIGTSTPLAKMTVVDSNNTGIRFEQYNTADGVNIRTYRARGTPSIPGQVLINDQLTALSGFGFALGGAFSPLAAQISFFAAENFTAIANGSYITFRTTPVGLTASSEAMRIESSGKVGIGDASPSGKLQVVTGNISEVGLIVSGAAIGQSADLLRVEESDSGVRRLTVTAAGNVGISASAPNAPLEVSGISVYNGLTNSVILSSSADTNGIQFINIPTSNAATAIQSSSGELQFWTKNVAGPWTSDQKRVVIDTAGNVGIGLTGGSPLSKLHVNGVIRWGGDIPAPYSYSGGDSSGLFIEHRGTTAANENIRIQTSRSGDAANYSTFTLDPTSGFSFSAVGTANSRVGIGISPLTNLHVKGSQISGFTGTTRGLLTLSGLYVSTFYTPIDFLYTDSGFPTARIAAYHDGAGSRLMFGTSNNYTSGITNTAMTIDQLGNVGVGTGLLTIPSLFQVGGALASNRYAAIDSSGRGTFRFDDNSVPYGLTLENRDTLALTNHGVGQLFNLANNVTDTPINAALVKVAKEQTWTSVATTQDAYFAVSAATDGILREKMRIKSSGEVQFDSHPANLWGQGRPGAALVNASGECVVTVSGRNVKVSRGSTAVKWEGANASCPANWWVCSATERGVAACGAGGALTGTYTCDHATGAGDTLVYTTPTHAWVADRGTTSYWGKLVNTSGVSADGEIACYTYPTWCCAYQ